MSIDSPSVPEGTITLLSTDLVGSTLLNQALGDDASASIEREIKSLALEQMKKSGGIVIKDTGDGLMVAFRSARKAVICAKEFQRTIAQRNNEHPEVIVQLRIGLHTGEVLSENGDSRGETVIITKRVEEASNPGEIFASETVYGVLGTMRSELEDQGDFNLKGITTPWHLYRVPWSEAEVSKVLAPNIQTPFIGRTQELKRLIEQVESAKKASGSFILIAGESGIGKTRLTEEVTREAKRLGLLVLLGHCMEMEGAPPYLPLIEIIEHSARIVDPEALRNALGDNAPEVAKLLPDLRRRYSDIPDPITLPPEQERRYLQHGVCEYIERGSMVQPMLLIFENLHWADESTLLLLHHLAQRLQEIPVIVLGTYRHTEVKPRSPFSTALPNLLRQRLGEEIMLARFTEKEVATLLEERTGKKPPPELVSLMYSETEGNPFFLESLLHHLHESGKLLVDDGQFKTGIQISDTEVPRGVRLIISQRLQGVSKECYQMLTTAAALGHTFEYGLITVLAKLEEDTLLDALDEAEEANILRDISKGRDVRYMFVQEQVRQTLLSELSTPRRQRLHLRIAEAMEQIHGEYVEVYSPEIANHLYQAGAMADGARTARYLMLAGERARAASAFDEAIEMFDAAESVLPAEDSFTLGNILYFLGMAVRGTGQMEDALAAFQSSIDRLQPGKDQDRSIHARAQLLLDLFRGHEAVTDLERLLARAQETGDRKGELESLLGLGRAYYIVSLNESSGGERALDFYEKAYLVAKEIGDKAGMTRALLPTNHFTDYWPDFREKAIANIDEAEKLAKLIEDEELISDCAQARFRFLSPKERIEQVDEHMESFKAIRDPLRLKEYYYSLMWLFLMAGEFTRSVEVCDKGIKLAKELGAKPVQYSTLKALSLINLGRYGEAWDALQQEVTEESFGYVMQQYGITFYLADLMAFSKVPEQAQKTSQLAEELNRPWIKDGVQKLRMIALAHLGSLESNVAVENEQDLELPGPGHTRLPIAETIFLKGSLEEGLEQTERALTRSERDGNKLHSIPALELKCRILFKMNRIDNALTVAEEGCNQAIKSEFRSILWRILAERAKIKNVLGDLTGAREDFHSAGVIVDELAETIPDAELKRIFKSNPRVTAIWEEI